MRLRRLDLLAYGPFEKAHLDLSAGSHGLHIVFGPNEAGKSSSLRALTCLLFGFPKSTPDDFLHNYSALRVGGWLENAAGETLQCIRRKGNSKTLRDGNDELEISDAKWRAMMPEITREQFESMFGLTHESLRNGGEEIAKGGGKLGETLFSSASGLVGLRDKQTQLDTRIEDLYRARGKCKLRDSSDRYKELREQQKSETVSVEQWTRKQEELKQKRHDFEHAQQQWDATQRNIKRLQRIQSALGSARRLQLQRERWKSLASAALVEEDFGQKAIELQSQERNLRQQLLQDQKQLDAWREQQSQLGADDPILERAKAIEGLLKKLGEYEKGQSDLPKLLSDQKRSEDKAREILRAMGRPEELDESELQRWRIPEEQVSHIQALALKFGGLEQRVKDRSHQLRKSESSAEQKDAPEFALLDEGDRTRLQRALQAAQNGATLETACRNKRTRFETDCAAWQESMQRASMPAIEIDAWCVRPLPSADGLVAFEQRWSELEQRDNSLREKQSTHDHEAGQMQAQLESLESQADIPTREQWQQAIARRDALWQRWRQSESSAESLAGSKVALESEFEQALQEADAIATRLIDFSDRVARAQELRSKIRVLESQRAVHARQRAELEWARDRWRQDWAEHWKGLTGTPQSVPEMRAWLSTLEQCRAKAIQLVQERRDIQSEESAIESHRQALVEAIDASGIHSAASSSALDVLIDAAQKALEADDQRRHAREAAARERQKQQQSLLNVREELADAQHELEVWRDQWSAAMASIGLPSDAEIEQVKLRLKNAGDLANALREANALGRRIAGIQQDAAALREQAHGLASQIGIDREGEPLENLIQRIDQRYRSAVLEQQQRSSLREQIENRERELEERTLALEKIEAELQAMIQRVGCDEASELYAASEKSRQRHQCEAQIADLESQLVAQSDGVSLEVFLETVLERSEDDLQTQLGRLEHESTELQSQLLEASQMKKDCEREVAALDRNGVAAAIASQASGIASEFEEQWREYAVLRLCSIALKHGIDRFRERNQNPILLEASRSFAHMTGGGFTRLKLDSEDDQQILVGVRDTEELVKVEHMSDGTRDQLYLALRLAAIRDWNSRHEPIPLVLDDILVHFDDERSIATLEQLAAISDTTQVIFFTHHQHLADLAVKTLATDRVFVHRLDA